MNKRTVHSDALQYFPDHFSGVSGNYAAFRPSYPEQLFTWLARITPSTDEAWDCATGTGQAALGLARHFRHVTASDASPEQIVAAAHHPYVTYRVATAEASGIADEAVDLVTVAQALHWLDTNRFFDEARRVLRPGGVLAVWAYGTPSMEEHALNALLQEFYHSEMGPFWPAERKLVDEGYRRILLPFAPVDAPKFGMRVSWSMEELLGYIRTWSAVSRFVGAKRVDPVSTLEKRLSLLWGPGGKRKTVTWPLTVKASRKQKQ